MCVIKTKSTTTHPPPTPSPPSFFSLPSHAPLADFLLAPFHLWASSQARFLRTDTRELKQKRRRRLWKRLFKSKVALLQKRYRTYSNSFNSSNVGNFFLDLNSKKLYQSSGKENESRCRVFTSSTKRDIRHFYVVVVQRLQRNVQKSVMHVQSCCFAKLLKPIAFLTFSLTSPSSLLRPPIATEDLSLRTKNCIYSSGELCSNVSDTPTCKPSPITSEVTTLHELIYPQAVRLPDCKWLGRTLNHSSLWTVLIMLTICKKTFMWYLLLQF